MSISLPIQMFCCTELISIRRRTVHLKKKKNILCSNFLTYFNLICSTVGILNLITVEARKKTREKKQKH